MAVPTFVDRVRLFVSAGRGGNGVASVHREKFKPLGGPDGGNGGPGGSVVLRVDPDVTTLVEYHHSPKRRADNGAQGAGSHRNGAHGGDLVLPVPDGTVVTRADGTPVADLVGPGTELVVAAGGRGGLGNAALASAKRKAPGFALLGEPGEELEIVLELKVVADIGLVGFPSAGKSSLIAALSRARPRIADYPFTTLVDYHHSPKRRADNGGQGAGSHRNGAHGGDLVLPVPDGTVVTHADGTPVADLVGPGTQLVVAAGGRGGLGNAALASSKRKAPGFALLGEPGEERRVVFELKVVADIGLVGFPSAGKSSLIAAISRARPKIADYPFTTLVPNLGVVVAGDTTFTVADVPGLIEGASDGKGLGHDFLRHVERCAAIVHVVDTASLEADRNPVRDLEVIEAELSRYGGLEDRPRLVVLNKVDLPDGADLADIVEDDVRALGHPVLRVSAITGEGLKALSFAMAEIVAAARAARPAAEPTRIVIRPEVKGSGADFTIKETGEGWRVRGEKPERWVRQTDFSNDEAVGFLADRLNRLGVEERLLELGAVEGDAVLIGHPDNAVVFDFKPGMDAGEQNLGRRGEDSRFSEQRPAAVRRRAIDEAFASREPHEARADIALRLAEQGIVLDAAEEADYLEGDAGLADWESAWDEDDPGDLDEDGVEVTWTQAQPGEEPERPR